ncbi:zinc-finger homeodomain protein 4 [Phtheirospermum japonicum]|uniref:Zinc-finger homeodomain protein 4 n=1 Tax=Phtheirospermum japonicum TaxID=374723 RepID=A0A830B4M3_9LAMI|nr:zinc-finger homeodomain protein 4 [Phtheirospermum japonicum]
MGAHVVDGCGKFIPSGEDGTLEALRCAARLRLPPQLPPERRRRRADADGATPFLLWHQQ